MDPAFRGGSRMLFTQKEAVGPTDMLFLGRARAVHQEEPGGACRLLRGHDPRDPLVHGPRQS